MLRYAALLRGGMGPVAIRSLAAPALGICLGLLLSGCAHNKVQVPQTAQPPHARVAPQPSVTAPAPKVARRADFNGEAKSRLAQRVANWVVDSGDNTGLPFALVDKPDARVFVFSPDGRLNAAAPCLLGLAIGDVSPPDIGTRKLADVRPDERTTPAGRFVATIGDNFNGKDVLWVDYAGAVSMHRVITSRPQDRRLERLNSPTPADNRISFGCINVPVDFFENTVRPAFKPANGIVYVLPEVKTVKEVFAKFYEVD